MIYNQPGPITESVPVGVAFASSASPKSIEIMTTTARLSFERSLWAATAGQAPELQSIEPDTHYDVVNYTIKWQTMYLNTQNWV